MKAPNRATGTPEQVRFKANFAPRDDVAAVAVSLNGIEQVDGWNVDTNSPDNPLTVQTTDNRVADVVTQAIKQAGYRAEIASG